MSILLTTTITKGERQVSSKSWTLSLAEIYSRISLMVGRQYQSVCKTDDSLVTVIYHAEDGHKATDAYEVPDAEQAGQLYAKLGTLL